MEKIRLFVKIALICLIVATIVLLTVSLTLLINETILDIIQISSFVILALMAFLYYEKVKIISIVTFVMVAFMIILFIIGKL